MYDFLARKLSLVLTLDKKMDFVFFSLSSFVRELFPPVTVLIDFFFSSFNLRGVLKNSLQ